MAARNDKRTVLITGCSDGSLGSHLALAMNNAGWRVFASARDLAKLKTTADAGIESVKLDTLSSDSLTNAAAEVSKLAGGSLDMLINNAGAGYAAPLMDVDLDRMRDIFELNVYSIISVSRTFLPLLRRSTITHGGKQGGFIVNNTSGAGLTAGALPFNGAYNASKAAAINVTEMLRLELAPFGIRVLNLVTGSVRSGFHGNAVKEEIPTDSIYSVAKERIEETLAGNFGAVGQADPTQWAKSVAAQLSKSDPPMYVWEGKYSTLAWLGTFLPIKALDSTRKSMTGLDVVERRLAEQQKAGSR